MALSFSLYDRFLYSTGLDGHIYEWDTVNWNRGVISPSGKSWHHSIIDRGELFAIGIGKETPVLH